MLMDLDRVKKEIYGLENFKFQSQFILQGVKNQKDLEYGTGRSCDLNNKDEEFIIPLYDIPYINSIMMKLGMYRTRVMCMKPKTCYSWHADYTKRIHIPLESDWEECFMLVGDDIIKMKPDGNYYEIDTTKMHTAVNASKSIRVHIVGLV